MTFERTFGSIIAALVWITPTAVTAQPNCHTSDATLLVGGLRGTSGSSIGPGGALYVTEALTGSILRVDPQTGVVSTFASGLPTRVVGPGGAIDVAFMGQTAYVLVTLVGSDVGGSNTVGIYRVDSPDTFTVVADIGAFSLAHPPATDFFVPTGVQFALEAYRGGFLVTDGHHNRVLRVTLNGAATGSLEGTVTEFRAFDNIVPTGLSISGNTVYMAEAGPVPHEPQQGKVVAFGPKSSSVTQVAAGARLLVDVEFGRGQLLYALSQGEFPVGAEPGAPALPNTGALVRVNSDGTFSLVIDGLDRPSSVEFIRNTAYVVTLGGEIWKIEDVSCSPFGAVR